MANHITYDTYENWKENIEYLVGNCSGRDMSAEATAVAVLDYLEGEGAFEVLDRKEAGIHDNG